MSDRTQPAPPQATSINLKDKSTVIISKFTTQDLLMGSDLRDDDLFQMINKVDEDCTKMVEDCRLRDIPVEIVFGFIDGRHNSPGTFLVRRHDGWTVYVGIGPLASLWVDSVAAYFETMRSLLQRSVIEDDSTTKMKKKSIDLVERATKLTNRLVEEVARAFPSDKDRVWHSRRWLSEVSASN